MQPLRTIIIGLDGATFDLIDPWARAGFLPNLARLMEQGVRAPLAAWPNMNSAVAWSSIITGYNPGQHGIFDFGDRLAWQHQEWHPTTAADRRRRAFWQLLSDAGQQVGVINVPISYPANPLRGFMLAGMDAPSVNSPGFAHPPDLMSELRLQGIDYVLDVPGLGRLCHKDPGRVPEPVTAMMDSRSRTILHLMDSRPWDALMAVLVAPDRMQHFYWPEGREAPDDGPDWAPIRGVYQQVDRFLSNVLARVGQNTVVLVVSDHGFGPRRLASNCLNPMLARVGLLRFRADVRPRRPLGFLLRWGRRRLPLPFQYLLAKRLPALYVRAVSQSKNPDVDWSRTQVFASLRGRSIWINLKGRQAYGIVPPEEYEALRQRVSELLLTLTDPATGRRVVRAVHRREDVFRGPYLDRAADLLVEWDEVIAGDGLAYPDGGQPVYARPQSRRVGEAGWTANHRSEGVFIAWGPGVIRPGVTLTESAHAARPVTHYDISPTVLHLQGLPVPADMDGRVLAEIFTEEYHRGHAVRIGQSGATADRTVGLEADEARLVEERLRSLGYLE